MAIQLYRSSIDNGLYYDAGHPEYEYTHVAWPVDDLPRLAHIIHRTVLDLVVRGAAPHDVDATIVDLLRGTTPDTAPVPAAG